MSLIGILAAAWVLGGLILARLWPGGDPTGTVLRMLAGISAAALLTLAAGSYSLNLAQALLYGTGFAGLAWELTRKEKTDTVWPTVTWPVSYFERACAGAVGLSLFFAFLSALAPVTGWDAAVAHLALPQDYVRAGQIVLNPGNVYSGYPQFMHGLYAVALAGGGETSATLINWTMAALACAAIFRLGCALDGPRTGWLAAAMLATAPIFLDQADNPSIDLAFTALVLGAMVALARFFETERWGTLILAALLAGSACGVRHTGYVVCVLLTVGVLIGPGSKQFRSALLFAAVALLCMLPWMVRSWLVAGNPFFPFLGNVFSSPIVHVGVSDFGAHETVGKTGGVGILALLRFPWDIVMRPGDYDGWSKSPGGLVLALGVPGLVLGGYGARALGVFGAAGGVFFFFFQRFARYLLPFFAPIYVVAALGVNRFGRGKRLVLAMVAVYIVYGLTIHAAAVHFKVPAAFRAESRSDYLHRRVERYAAFDYVNTHCNDGGAVLTVDQRSYYLDPPAFQNHWDMQQLITMPPLWQYYWLYDRGIRYVMVPVEFVEESGALRPLAPVFDAWRKDKTHFTLLEKLTIPRPSGGLEHVEIYRFEFEEE